MTNIIFKSPLYQKFREFKSFFILICLIILTVIIVNIYDKFRDEQVKKLENILQNVYLQKTLLSISSSLKPRFEKINYVINAGESFEGILNEIKINKKEKNKILDFIIKKKNKI